MIKESNFEPKLVLFVCENSVGMSLPEGTMNLGETFYSAKLIKLPCAGNVDVLYFLKALEGADGKAIIACQLQCCKYIRGNNRALQRVAEARKRLLEIGLEQERVQMFYMAANEETKFQSTIDQFAQLLHELGPNLGKVKK